MMIRHLIAACTVFILPVAAWAVLPITQIAITGAPAPDGGTFTSFGAPTTDRQTPFAAPIPFFFTATTSNGISGVYYDTYENGNLVQSGTVADTTQAAATGATFTSFSNLSSGFGEVGFIATDSNGVQAVYAGDTLPLPLIATTSTLTPSGVPFGTFQSVSIMGAYYYGKTGGEIESNAGIYYFDNLDSSGELEFQGSNEASFTSLGPVSYKSQQGGSLSPGIMDPGSGFRGKANGVVGIYAAASSNYGGNLANVGSAVPDANGNPTAATFTSFGNPVVTTNEITFSAHYNVGGQDQQGIFTYGMYQDPSIFVPPTLKEIVATGQVAPDSGGATFTGFSDVTDDSWYQIFLASLSDGKTGLYFYGIDPGQYNPQLFAIVETGDTLFGKSIASIALSPDASIYNAGAVAFEVDFTDGTQGVYFSNLYDDFVPEPASLPLLGLCSLLLFRYRPYKFILLTHASPHRHPE